MITEYEGYDEEADTEEDSHTGDKVDEVSDLLGYGRFTDFETRGQVGNSAHDGTISSENDNASRRTCEEPDVIIRELLITVDVTALNNHAVIDMDNHELYCRPVAYFIHCERYVLFYFLPIS